MRLPAGARSPDLARAAQAWVRQLAWRDFFAHLLLAEPRLARESMRPLGIRWRIDDRSFRRWQRGETGVPLVDAGMRELAASGLMHNRVRMVAASFLTRQLLLDWRDGERHFMTRLVDGDLASNNGGWQWAASTGTDAQPYFRIFHPVKQGQRFDPDGAYVRRFVPELRGVDARFVHCPWEAPSPPRDYPAPIVDHAERRQRALRRFESIRTQAKGTRERRGRNLALF